MDYRDLIRDAADRMNIFAPIPDAEFNACVAHLNAMLEAWRTETAFQNLELRGRPITEAEFRRMWGTN